MNKEVIGVVIHERNYLDNDKIISIYSNNGKLYQVKVNNVRKLKSKYRSKAALFNYGKFTIKEHIDRFSTIRDIEIDDYFFGFKTDFNKYYYALYFCELVYKLGNYNNFNSNSFNYFFSCLKRLSSDDLVTTRILYELNLLKDLGLSPYLNNCVVCNNPDVVSIDYKLGGYICNNCITTDTFKYNLKTLAIFRILYYYDINSQQKIVLSNLVKREIIYFLSNYFNYHVNIKINSQQFLKEGDNNDS